MQSKDKVFGAPLQKLYRDLLQVPHAPRQPELIRVLTASLADQGLNYHPRTLKRQLLGSIEYIPEVLEQSVIHWMQSHPVTGQKKLLDNFARDKAKLEQASDDSLYVSPRFLQQMADVFLFRHKGMSRRKLALQLSDSLKARKISLGLETLQAALSGKTQKVRKVLEEELLKYFLAEGFKDRSQIEAFIQGTDSVGHEEVQKVEVGDLSSWTEAYLLKHPGLSRRQLALRLRQRLTEKGYVYHLSSVQSVLEGKTRKTRRVIVDSLQEMLQADGLDAQDKISNFVQTTESGQREWNHYVSGDQVPAQVNALLGKHPGLTRRRIALQLRADLQKKGFNFSLSTLQYLLAGKTQRIKKVVADRLEAYLRPETTPEFAAARAADRSLAGRATLQKRLEELYEVYQKSDKSQKQELRQNFFQTRWELIRRISLQRGRAAASKNHRAERGGRGMSDPDAPESFLNGSGESTDIPVAYDVRDALDRLVS